MACTKTELFRRACITVTADSNHLTFNITRKSKTLDQLCDTLCSPAPTQQGRSPTSPATNLQACSLATTSPTSEETEKTVWQGNGRKDNNSNEVLAYEQKWNMCRKRQRIREIKDNYNKKLEVKGFRNEAKNDRDHQLWEVRWGWQSWGESTKCSWFQSVFPSWADHLELSVSVNNPWVYLLQKAHPAVDRAPPESSACPPTADSLDRCRPRWKHAGGCSLWSGGPAIICYTWWNYGAEQLNIWSVGGVGTSWSTLYLQRFTGDIQKTETRWITFERVRGGKSHAAEGTEDERVVDFRRNPVRSFTVYTSFSVHTVCCQFSYSSSFFVIVLIF